MNTIENLLQPPMLRAATKLSSLSSRFVEKALERIQADEGVKVELSSRSKRGHELNQPEHYQAYCRPLPQRPDKVDLPKATPEPPEATPAQSKNPTTTEASVDDPREMALAEFARAFGTTSVTDEKYNPLADFDQDGDVDGSDLAVFAKNYMA